MRTYTANEIKEVIRTSYMDGWRDGKHSALPPSPPPIEDVVDHPYTGSLRTLIPVAEKPTEPPECERC